MKKTIRRIAAGMAGVVLIAEIALRVAGVVDFPLYVADAEVGYIPAPSQAGSFMRHRDWKFNALSMGAEEFQPSVAAVDVLLVGDSVVLGGNPYRQEDRLGPRLGQRTPHRWWPISAGSWALRNELAYLHRQPEVVRSVDSIVFVLNSGDFDKASSWACELSHPRSRPLLATWYVVQKYVLKLNPCGFTPSQLQVPAGDWRPELRSFINSDGARGKRIVFFLYPDLDQARDQGLRSSKLEVWKGQLESAGAKEIHSVGQDPRWTPQLYQDGIHPSAEGFRVLADIIATNLGVVEPAASRPE